MSKTHFSIRYKIRFAEFPEKREEQTFTIFSFRRFNGTFNDRGFRQHTGGPASRYWAPAYYQVTSNHHNLLFDQPVSQRARIVKV